MVRSIKNLSRLLALESLIEDFETPVIEPNCEKLLDKNLNTLMEKYLGTN